MHLVLGWEIAGPVELQVDQILGGKNYENAESLLI